MPLLVGFERAGQRLLTVIDVGAAGLEDPGLEARKAWMPVSVQVLTRELAEKLGLADSDGSPGHAGAGRPAAGRRLQVGDIITAVDGDPVQASQPSDADLFATMIRQYKIGTTVELSVVRGKTPQKVKVALETSPRLPREMKKYEDPNFEFRVRDIAAADRLEEGIDRRPVGRAGRCGARRRMGGARASGRRRSAAGGGRRGDAGRGGGAGKDVEDRRGAAADGGLQGEARHSDFLRRAASRMERADMNTRRMAYRSLAVVALALVMVARLGRRSGWSVANGGARDRQEMAGRGRQRPRRAQNTDVGGRA